MLPHYRVKNNLNFRLDNGSFIHVHALAGLICTTSRVNREYNRYLRWKCFKVIYFINYSNVVNKRLHCAIVSAERFAAREQ